MNRVVVIGAGIGGLAAAATLAQAGVNVTVLEAHVYPGGCAGTFYHKGYRFDAGATLAGGFYSGGPMDLLAKAAGISTWPIRNAEPSMVVHLPGDQQVIRWEGEQRRYEYQQAFGPLVQHFWDWQESTADALWELASRNPSWPPQSLDQVRRLLSLGIQWFSRNFYRFGPGFLADAFRPVAAHLKGMPENFRLFIDAQLMIAAQTTSKYTYALYGASALDLPRRGVVHLEGGIGAIATILVDAIRKNGGQVLFRQEAIRILQVSGRPVAVRTRRGLEIPADVVIANLPPWNIVPLLGGNLPRRLSRLSTYPDVGWGAFTIYVGLDGALIPEDFPLHHQVILGEPLGEGNSLFLSISPSWDNSRAPDNGRALTISTHTAMKSWWDLYYNDNSTYQARKQEYVDRILAGAEVALPWLRHAKRLILPGTPVSFQHFTRRIHGWVGGFPQTSLFRFWGPRLSSGIWMVGDSIFPGQSTAAVALGGVRVAQDVLA